MPPIFNRHGRTVGWLRRNVVYNLRGSPRAFLEDDVISFRGRYLGTLENGFFRDRDGYAIAFVERTSGGPVLPITEVPPVQPVLSVTPVRPVYSLNWSNTRFEDFL